LHACLSELRRIKQAIVEGRLWEHLELRAHGHPSLLQALKHLRKYEDYLESHSPITKKSGLFFFGSLGLIRPEVVRHKKRISERYSPPEGARVLVLLPQTRTKPFHKSKEHQKVLKEIQRKLGNRMSEIHVCTYAAPFGIVPIELDEVYPLSQYEVATPLDVETINYTARQVSDYVTSTNYKEIVLLQDVETWKGKIATACRRACKEKRIVPTVLRTKKPWNESTLSNLVTAIQNAIT
ncbi:MAG: DUF5591 domain-containing protein, partial [Candidatus Bathyarchaeia archaeon]